MVTRILHTIQLIKGNTSCCYAGDGFDIDSHNKEVRHILNLIRHILKLENKTVRSKSDQITSNSNSNIDFDKDEVRHISRHIRHIFKTDRSKAPITAFNGSTNTNKVRHILVSQAPGEIISEGVG